MAVLIHHLAAAKIGKARFAHLMGWVSSEDEVNEDDTMLSLKQMWMQQYQRDLLNGGRHKKAKVLDRIRRAVVTLRRAFWNCKRQRKPDCQLVAETIWRAAACRVEGGVPKLPGEQRDSSTMQQCFWPRGTCCWIPPQPATNVSSFASSTCAVR